VGPPELSAREAALAPPRAYGAPPASGVLRAEPEDFVVEEELGFAPAGSGAHLLLKVRKRNANTQWVARELTRITGCRPADAGYAGLKDRRAVAVQWFTVPRPRTAVDWQALRIRVPSGDGAEIAERLASRLEAIAQRGVPNYFGAQRFGRDGGNLQQLGSPLHRLPPTQRGFVLSAARSVIFNAVLAARVIEGSWERLRAGDLANLDGRGSIFPVEALDAELLERCRRLEIHPSGPLWGGGDPASAGEVLELERTVAARCPDAAAACAAAGMVQERRSLRVAVHELRCEVEAQAVRIHFRLGRGCFATAVLAELIETEGAMPESG
jgi:tRNA pseudouridine13 synthase